MDETERQEFFKDVCDVVEEHGDSIEEMVELIESLEEFTDCWVTTYSITGALWRFADKEMLKVQLANGEIIEVPKVFIEYLENNGNWRLAENQ